jgi:hypothetical protein
MTNYRCNLFSWVLRHPRRQPAFHSSPNSCLHQCVSNQETHRQFLLGRHIASTWQQAKGMTEATAKLVWHGHADQVVDLVTENVRDIAQLPGVPAPIGRS